MLTRWLIPIVLFAAAEQPSFGPIRFEDVTEEIRHPLHAQLRRRETRVAAREHRRRRGVVRLQQRRLSDLYVVSGKPLEAGMHPYPVAQAAASRRRTITCTATTATAHFTDVTEQAGVARRPFSMAAIAADYDNDGNVDLLVTGYGRVILYRNNGDGTFEDVTEKAGLNVPDGPSARRGWTTIATAAWTSSSAAT